MDARALYIMLTVINANGYGTSNLLAGGDRPMTQSEYRRVNAFIFGSVKA